MVNALLDKLAATPNPEPQNVDPAEEILKYKNLLDIGAITQEEYNEKKRQLLHLG